MKTSRNYPLLLASQFLGAFGDNAVLAVLVGPMTFAQQAGTLSAETVQRQNAVMNAMLFIPCILLAPLAGHLNDRYAKTRWLAGGNAVKLLGTILCMAALPFGFWAQACGYVIVGVGTALYGPAKYGILPEILERERLVRANAMVELLTLVAILTGSIGGAVLSDAWRSHVDWSLGVVAAVYGASFALNLLMSPTPSNPSVPLSGTLTAFFGDAVGLYRSPRLGRVLAGTALFWFCGAAMKMNFQPWGLNKLHLMNNTEISLMGLWLSVGVMAGSLLAGRCFGVSDLRTTRRWAWLLAGLLGLLMLVNDGWLHPSFAMGSVQIAIPVVLALVAAGVAAGLFLIPLNAALQAESDPTKLGKTIAIQNLNDYVGMLTASAFCQTAPALGLASSGVFGGIAAVVCVASFGLKFPATAKTESKS
jgi:MFS transporter, LPLT family, lysophospholipid transporter